MTTLFDKILFDGLHYNQLTNDSDKRMVENIVNKLKHLEADIINSKNGQISLRPSGNFFIDSFSKDLSDKISVALN